jgi:hypothetical protein
MQRPMTSQIVIDHFISIIDSQDKKGFEKYGKSIDEALNQDYNWELMALEETADLQKYLVRRIMEITGELIKAKVEISKQQKEIEGYIDDVEQMEGMLLQANERIKQLEKGIPVFIDGKWTSKASYMDLDD